MDKTYDIVSLGEILVDFVPDGLDEYGDERFLCKAGGAPLNVLATGAKFGLKTAFIGKVGNDIFGRKLKKILAENGIDASSVITDETHNTTLAFVKLDENGDRDFSFYRNFGADIFIEKSDVDTEKIAQAKIFHFGSLSFTDEPMKSATVFALETAKANHCIISYDPNYRPPLWKSEADAVEAMKENLKYVDIVKLSLEELYFIAETENTAEAVEKIKAYGVKAVIVTDGANDVFFTAEKELCSMPAKKVNAVDTTGAGDIFFGTFLTGFLKDGGSLKELDNEKMKKYIAKAIEKSAESVTKKGAIAAIPENF